MKNTFKTVRRAAVDHPFLAASIVAAGALFKDSVVGPDPGKADTVTALAGDAFPALAEPDARTVHGPSFARRRP